MLLTTASSGIWCYFNETLRNPFDKINYSFSDSLDDVKNTDSTSTVLVTRIASLLSTAVVVKESPSYSPATFNPNKLDERSKERSEKAHHRNKYAAFCQANARQKAFRQQQMYDAAFEQEQERKRQRAKENDVKAQQAKAYAAEAVRCVKAEKALRRQHAASNNNPPSPPSFEPSPFHCPLLDSIIKDAFTKHRFVSKYGDTDDAVKDITIAIDRGSLSKSLQRRATKRIDMPSSALSIIGAFYHLSVVPVYAVHIKEDVSDDDGLVYNIIGLVKTYVSIQSVATAIIILVGTVWYVLRGKIQENEAAPRQHPIMQACNIMYEIIHTTLSEFSPDALLERKEFKKLNVGVKKQVWDSTKGKLVPNPAFRTNTINGENETRILNKIARMAWNDPQVQAALLQVEVKTGDYIGHTVEEDGTLIKNQRDIYKILIVIMKGKTASTDTYFKNFVTQVIRKKSRTVPLEQARKNAKKGKGIFSGLSEGTANDYKKRLVALLNDGPESDYMSEQEADSHIVRMLEYHDMQYLWFLSIHQLAHLALRHVMFHSNLRREDVREDIEKFTQQINRTIDSVEKLPDDSWEDDDISSFSERLHNQELNELALMIEYMIKVKAKLISARNMLMDRRALFLDLSDDSKDVNNEENERIVPFDVVIPVLPHGKKELTQQICQGAAKRHFGDYKAFGGHAKTIQEGRYAISFGNARVFDFKSPAAEYKYKGKVVGGLGIPFGYGDGDIARELSYSVKGDDTSTLQVKISPGDGNPSHNFMLHRFLSIVASNHETTIFSQSALSSLGITIPIDPDTDEANFEAHFGYRTDNRTADSINRELQVGKAHSRQCDWDHCRGREDNEDHGVLNGQELSHRKNICHSKTRDKGGSWFRGLHVMKYDGGVKKFKEELSPVLDGIIFPTCQQVADGVTFNGSGLRALDPFKILPAYTETWMDPEVDCQCSSTRDGKCPKCTFIEEEENKKKESKPRKKQRTNDDDDDNSDDDSVPDGYYSNSEDEPDWDEDSDSDDDSSDDESDKKPAAKNKREA